VLIGAIVGALAAGITRATYGIEDLFERLPVHWALWPAIGADYLGVIGWFQPRVLGIGYENITAIINGDMVGRTLLIFVIAKFLAWSIYLGSGTSGGTLAPLFTIGGGVGALLGAATVTIAPSANIDPRIAALVGMAAIFAGASHALLTAVVFTFEITRQSVELLPLLAGGTAAYLVSLLLSRTSIMTEKLARRGVSVHSEYSVDYLSQRLVRDMALRPVVTIRASDDLGTVRHWLASHAPGSTHQGFPVVDDNDTLVGVLTRRDLVGSDEPETATIASMVRRAPVVVFADSTLRDAADQMVRASVGRLPVVERSSPYQVVGMLSRSDLLAAHAGRLEAGKRKRSAVTI
jgi:CBS domain-containing protein